MSELQKSPFLIGVVAPLCAAALSFCSMWASGVVYGEMPPAFQESSHPVCWILNAWALASYLAAVLLIGFASAWTKDPKEPVPF